MGGRDAAFAQIGARLGTPCTLQLVLKELSRQFHDIVERRALFLTRLGLRIAGRHRHAGHIGHPLDRLREGKPVKFGQKPEMIAADAATETVVAAFLIFAVKTRRVFAVKRATGPPVATRSVGLAFVPRHT